MARRNQGPRLKWHRKGSGWYICWNEAGRYFERSTGTKDSEEAQIVFAEWMQARQRKHGPSDPAKILVTDVLSLYATERGPNVVEPRVIGCAIDVLSRYWEGQTVVEVDRHTTELYAKKRARSPGTVRRELSVLRAAINYAFHRGMLTRAVWVQLPPAPPPRDRWLTRQEAAHLLRAACTKKARFYLPLFILIGLYTGRRSEAILSLRWPQVDLERGLIDFDLPERGRTDKRRGIVRIPPRLLPHLRRARHRGTDLGYVVHDGGKHIGTIKAGFEAACRRAGIEGVTPHTLRHTAASWLMQAGISAWDAGQFLSMSVETLHRIYAHHSPESMERAANALSGKRFRVISR
jgi:integrase